MDDRLHVLIAEDETIIRLDLRQLLEAEGLVVCAEARDGLETPFRPARSRGHRVTLLFEVMQVVWPS
jgi:DNA-binding NarL/FixJ family response regulator